MCSVFQAHAVAGTSSALPANGPCRAHFLSLAWWVGTGQAVIGTIPFFSNQGFGAKKKIL